MKYIVPVVRALMRPARRPLKSLKTSSTVRGLYCVRESIVDYPGLLFLLLYEEMKSEGNGFRVEREREK
jgi:hypothetical protein